MANSYEIIVIGGGPAGYEAALQAAKQGRKTALIEKDRLGGTCLNRGCIPSKALLKYAEVIHTINKAKRWGIETGEIHLNWERMVQGKNNAISKLRTGVHHLLKQANVNIYSGNAAILDNKTIQVESGSEKSLEIIQTEKIIVTTGSKPAIPPLPGLDNVSYHTSDTIFDVEKIPDSIVIIGGGYIGVEMAWLFSALNARVFLIEAAERLLPNEDKDAAMLLTKTFKEQGIQVLTNAEVKNVAKADEKIRLLCSRRNNEIVIEAESLLLSTGRRPNTQVFKHLKPLMDGPYIKVNEKMETSIPNIYAAGDVTGGFQLAHVAYKEGIVAANNAAGRKDELNLHPVPRAVYTYPEIAAAGLTEDEAKARGFNIRTEIFNDHGNGKAVATEEDFGFTKIIYDADFGEILGVIMMGPHATELISEASAFIYLEGTVDEIQQLIHPHPTFSESFYLAARNIFLKSKNL